MSEYELSAFVPTAVIEIWQNQSYWPIQGWSAPMGGPAHFVGENLQSNSDSFPIVQLPKGWEWFDEWEVDLSRSFGETDEDGWAYASSHEKISEMIKFVCTSGIPTTTSLARRRRWRRTLVCVSQEAKLGIQSRREQITVVRQRIEASLHEKQAHVDKIKEYEEKRTTSHHQTYSLAFASILRSELILKEQVAKLKKLKQFLTDRANVERDYARKLNALAAKYRSPVLQAKGAKARVLREEPDVEGSIQSVSGAVVVPTQPNEAVAGTAAPSPAKSSSVLDAASGVASSVFGAMAAAVTMSTRPRRQSVSEATSGEPPLPVAPPSSSSASSSASSEDIGTDSSLADTPAPALASTPSSPPRPGARSGDGEGEGGQSEAWGASGAASSAGTSSKPVPLSQSPPSPFQPSVSLAPSSQPSLATELASNGPWPKFFDRMSRINELVATRLADFSSLVMEVLIQDIDTLLKETAFALQECRASLHPDSASWKSLNDLIAGTLVSLEGTLQSVSDAAVGEVGRLSEELNSTKGGLYMGNVLARSPTTAPKEDLWLGVQKYRRAVALTESSLLVLTQMAQRLDEKQLVLVHRIRSLFIATVQLFAHEQARAWSESGELLLEMCSETVRAMDSAMDIAMASAEERSIYMKDGGDAEGWVGVKVTDGAEKKNSFVENMTAVKKMLPPLPSLPSVIMAGHVLVAGSNAVRKSKYTGDMPGIEEVRANHGVVRWADVLWLLAYAVATSDGFLHVIKLDQQRHLNIPAKSMVLKQCEMLTAFTSVAQLLNGVEIRPAPTQSIFGILETISAQTDGLVLYSFDAKEAYSWFCALCDPFGTPSFVEEASLAEQAEMTERTISAMAAAALAEHGAEVVENNTNDDDVAPMAIFEDEFEDDEEEEEGESGLVLKELSSTPMATSANSDQLTGSTAAADDDTVDSYHSSPSVHRIGNDSDSVDGGDEGDEGALPVGVSNKRHARRVPSFNVSTPSPSKGDKSWMKKSPQEEIRLGTLRTGGPLPQMIPDGGVDQPLSRRNSLKIKQYEDGLQASKETMTVKVTQTRGKTFNDFGIAEGGKIAVSSPVAGPDPLVQKLSQMWQHPGGKITTGSSQGRDKINLSGSDGQMHHIDLETVLRGEVVKDCTDDLKTV